MGISIKDKGKLVSITKNNITYKGFLIDLKDNQEITIKLLDNGYNIEIALDSNTKIELENEKKTLGKKPKAKIKQDPSLFPISIIATGGTIGTHIDYKTGGVNMSRSPEEIIQTVPELLNIVNIKNIKSVTMKGSEDLGYKDWQKIAIEVYNQLKNPEVEAIVILHGTDTLTWTGTALSFMLENINKPILLVGAQKSPDRASFDGAMNLICAAHFSKQKVPGVYTVMHGSSNDDFCNVITATKARKMHTTRRDAFKAINDIPLANVYQNGKIEFLKEKPIQKKTEPKLFTGFSDEVALLKTYPNSDPKILDWFIKKNYKGIILEGTGLGHSPTGLGGKDKSFDKKKNWCNYIKKARDKGIIVIMSSQCLSGRVNGNVYANLRHLREAGVNYLDNHDMLPEVCYIKLAIALERFKTKEEILKYMKTNALGELSDKELPNSFDSFD